MMRDVAPAASFYRIKIGLTDVVWLMQTDRASKARAVAELDYWRGLFGDLAQLETLSGGEDLVVRHMAQAIQAISKDGSGVRPEMLRDLGFAADVVARRFVDAQTLVIASLPQDEREAEASNVIAVRFGARRPEAS